MEKGLLSRYVMRKLRDYEPKAGKKKGIPGFSWEKYSASVLSITSMASKDMAGGLKVSYGVLRNWRTEPRFKILVKWHIQEFLEIVINHAKEKQKRRREKEARILEKPLEEIAKTASYPTLGYDEFKDGDLYAPELIGKIFDVHINMTDKIIEKAENLSLVDLLDEYSLPNELSGILDALMFSRKDDEYIRKQRQRCKRERRILDRRNLQLMIGIVMHKDFNEEHKKILVYSLSSQKKQIEEELEREAKKKTKDSA
jgi:hypothetical protein